MDFNQYLGRYRESLDSIREVMGKEDPKIPGSATSVKISDSASVVHKPSTNRLYDMANYVHDSITEYADHLRRTDINYVRNVRLAALIILTVIIFTGWYTLNAYHQPRVSHD